MFIQFLVAFAVALFGLSVITAPLARLLRMPQALLLVIVGALGAFLFTSVLGIDTGLRAACLAALRCGCYAPA